MVGQRVSRRGRKPAGQRVARHAQHGDGLALRDGPRQLGTQRAVVGDEPDLVDAVALGAQRLAQLALQEQPLLARGIAGGVGDGHDEPLAAQHVGLHGPALERGQRECGRQVARGRDELPVVGAAALRAQHVVGEVRRDDRRCAHHHQQQHLHPPQARALRGGRLYGGQAMHGELNRLNACGAGDGRVGTRHTNL